MIDKPALRVDSDWEQRLSAAWASIDERSEEEEDQSLPGGENRSAQHFSKNDGHSGNRRDEDRL